MRVDISLSERINVFIEVSQLATGFPAQSQPRCIIQNFQGLIPVRKISRRSKHTLQIEGKINKYFFKKANVLGQSSLHA